jgi:hypothetical protein
MYLAKASPRASNKVACLGIRNRQGDRDLLLDVLTRESADSGMSGGLRSWRRGRSGSLRLRRFATSSTRAVSRGRSRGGSCSGGRFRLESGEPEVQSIKTISQQVDSLVEGVGSAWKSGPVRFFIQIWKDRDRDQFSQVERL